MSLQATNLLIQMAQLPPTFIGNPNALATEMVRRMKILSPSGTNFIFIGDNEPTSNVGPWLKGGTQWYVWDDGTKRYVPLDISASTTIPFFIGKTTPASSNPPVWLQTTQDATDVAPLAFGNPVSWYVFNGAAWVPYSGVVASGPTASRPAAPVNHQQYYDTDISCLIWWERNAWRTISGVPGDVKAVLFSTLDEALAFNPGWGLLGDVNQAYRGRILVQAAKNADGSGVLTLDTLLVARKAFEVFGEGSSNYVTVSSTNTNPQFPAQMALWHLYKQ